MHKVFFDPSKPSGHSDRRVTSMYARAALPEDVVFRINVALATARPLVVVGPDGSGRDSLAESVASVLGWNLYRYTFSATSTPSHLLYGMDETRRVADAQAGGLQDNSAYIEPGILWWAFDPQSAQNGGSRDASRGVLPNPDPGARTDAEGAVVHLSGHPPKDIEPYLLPIEVRRFFVREAGLTVSLGPRRLFPVLSVPDVRAIDPWIRQRSVLCYMRQPTRERLVEIARATTNLDPALIERVLDSALDIQQSMGRDPVIDPRSFVDTLRAIDALGINMGEDDPTWRALLDALMPS
jgi:hypothetical protein